MSARAKKPTTKPPPIPPRAKPPADYEPDEARTSIYDSTQRLARAKSQPIQAISMKTPGVERIAADDMRATPSIQRPKLRAISEVSPLSSAQPENLGYLAPPANPSDVRGRRVREVLLIVSLSIIVASIVALIIWFSAR